MTSTHNGEAFLPASAAEVHEGFWSKSAILVNTSDLPIWIGGSDTQRLTEVFQNEADKAFDDYFTSMAKLLLSQNGKENHSAAVGQSLKAYGIRTKPLADWTNAQVPMRLNRYPDYAKAFAQLQEVQGSLDASIETLKQVYRHALDKDGHKAILTSEFSCRMDSPSAMIRIDWEKWFGSTSLYDIVAQLRSIAELKDSRNIEDKHNRTMNIVSRLASLCKSIPVTQPEFSINTSSSAHVQRCNITALRTAARWAVSTLIREKYLLYPASWPSINHSPILYQGNWWASLADYLPYNLTWSRNLFYRLICSSTVRSPADLSVSLCLLYNPSTTGLCGSMIKGFSMAFQRYQTENPSLPSFPAGEINNRRKINLREEVNQLRSPENLRQEGIPEWAFAMDTFRKNAKLTRNGICEATRHLFDWAIENGFASPWEIETKHLINPLQSDDATFHSYLSMQALTVQRTGWNGASRFYKIVINALRPLPQFDSVIKENPFFGIKNPFSQTKRKTPLGKTHRRLIPSHLLSAMLETLLDCDSDGIPQYAWIKDRFPVDTAERYNHITKQFEVVWHPARARCMAILLLIPLRSKQARWLDQGLMDAWRWDVSTGEWRENEHPLRSYRYANGQTHLGLYGRPSGVLQPLDSLLGGNSDHIGLFISTNKTQLWDPEQRVGYTIPWPDGKELMQSNDEHIRLQGRNLGLVYQLIKEQISWLETYDPSPAPATFADDGEQFGKDTIRSLPAFCPIFRDLISPATKNQTDVVHVPISKQKLFLLFHALAAETEDRLITKGHQRDSVGLTFWSRNLDRQIKQGRADRVRKCVYDIHSLRVAGITNLLEMGVPAHIVSEFIAGHMALVMTLHYAKFEPLKLRQRIMDCYSEAESIQRFEQALEQHRKTTTGLLVTNSHFDHAMRIDQNNSLQVKGSWRYVNGGICPGTLCSEGGVKVIEEGKWTKHEIVEVSGGPESCGNCRFFMTGPAFLVPQMLTANSIMLQLREFGRHRKRLWDERAALEIKVFEHVATPRERVELTTIQSELEHVDRKIEPLVLEWYNRYEMFRQSQALQAEWDSLAQPDTQDFSLALHGSNDVVSLIGNLDPQGSEYTLVKAIVSQSEIIGGRRAVSELAEHKLREFLDRILMQENVTPLLLSITDAKQRRQASLMLSEALDVLCGNSDVVSQAVEANCALGLTPDNQYVLRELAGRLASDAWKDVDNLTGAAQGMIEHGAMVHPVNEV
jgi:hypothetical protein